MDTIKKKEKFLTVFRSNVGVIKDTCEAIKISRQTYYNWIKEDESFKNECDIIHDEAIDFVESKLFQNIRGFHETDQILGRNGVEDIKKYYKPDTTAIIFYLKTQGKKRGYIEKTEMDISTQVKDTLALFPGKLHGATDQS